MRASIQICRTHAIAAVLAVAAPSANAQRGGTPPTINNPNAPTPIAGATANAIGGAPGSTDGELDGPRLQFSWTPLKGIDEYRLLRSANSNGPFVVIAANVAKCAPTAVTCGAEELFKDQAHLAGTLQWYRVEGLFTGVSMAMSPAFSVGIPTWFAPLQVTVMQNSPTELLISWQHDVIVTKSVANLRRRDGPLDVWECNPNPPYVQAPAASFTATPWTCSVPTFALQSGVVYVAVVAQFVGISNKTWRIGEQEFTAK